MIGCHQANIPPLPTQSPQATLPLSHARIQARIALSQGARSVAVGGGLVWVSYTAERTITRIDPLTQQTRGEPIRLPFEPGHLAYGEGSIWVCKRDYTALVRIDPQTYQIIASIDLRSFQMPIEEHLWVAVGSGAVWLTNQTTVLQIDPATNTIVGEPIVAGEEIIAIAIGEGSFWSGSHDDGIVTRIDPASHTVIARIEVGFSVHGLAIADGRAWVLDEHGFAVVELNPVSYELGERIPIDFVAANLAAGAGSVWVAPAAQDSGQPTGNDRIVRIDANRRAIAESIPAGDPDTSQYYMVFFAGGSAWVLVDTPAPSLVQIAASTL